MATINTNINININVNEDILKDETMAAPKSVLNMFTNEDILKDETYPVPECILDMFNTTDRKLILRAVGETENFREEVMESDLNERLEELKEEIDLEVTYEGDTYVEFDQQVIFWLPADTTLINEYLECAWWSAQYAMFDQCQEFIDFAQGYTK